MMYQGVIVLLENAVRQMRLRAHPSAPPMTTLQVKRWLLLGGGVKEISCQAYVAGVLADASSWRTVYSYVAVQLNALLKISVVKNNNSVLIST